VRLWWIRARTRAHQRPRPRDAEASPSRFRRSFSPERDEP